MADIEELTHDHFRHPVPPERRVSGWPVALVIFGIGITLPIFFLGAELGQSLGIADAAAAFFGGCFLLGVLATVTAVVGARTGLSSYMIISFSFGRDGGKVVNILMAVALLGYFGATADIFGRAVQEAARAAYGVTDGRLIYTFLSCLLMTATAIFGFRAIEKLSVFAVPILAAFMMLAVVMALRQTPWDVVAAYPGKPDKVLGLALSTVVGSSIQSAVLMPDVTRFCRTAWDGVKAVSGLAIGFPLVFMAAAIPSIAVGETDIMLIMIGLGLAVPAFFTLLFSTWTTNTINLYSTAMTLATIFTRRREWQITLGAAVLGTALAMLGIMDHFIQFLLVLGITTPPIAGIYLADYFFVRGGRYDMADLAAGPRISAAAFVAWVVSSGLGFMTSYDVMTLSTMPAVDSLAAAFIIYLALRKWSLFRARAAAIAG